MDPFNPCPDVPRNAPPPSGKKRPYIIISVIASLILLFILGWIPRYLQKETVDKAAALDNLPRVRVMEVKEETKPTELVLPSSAEALHVTPIWARTNGYLINFLVDIGDHVKEGQLLAVIDTPEVDQQLKQSVADLKSSIARKDIAKISADRWQSLYAKNPEAISTQEVDERAATLRSAEADVVSFEKNVERLHYLQQFKKIYAPFDGIITKRDIDIGSLITQGSSGANPQELFQIAQTNIIRFFVDVPQYFFRDIHVGLDAEVRINEYPDRIFKGKVVRYAKALDPIARTMSTEVDVENPHGEIAPGLYATVRFALKPSSGRYIVPTNALIIRSGTPRIALVDAKDIVHIKSVQIGRDYGKTIEIVSGLEENDRIIINPTEKIVEGTKVEIYQ